tara:strand:- start:1596 stop:1925 length:330 start_codon:yes stop_codon:yes gene_type:complete
MISNKISNLKKILNIRAFQSAIYSHFHDDILDNGFIIDEIILDTDFTHFERTLIKVGIIALFIYAYFKYASVKEEKLETIIDYRNVKTNVKSLLIIIGIVFIKNIENAF